MSKKICVIGNFSGRNAGDAAILGGLLDDITRIYHDVEFEVPTINPAFVKKQYAGYPVKAIGMLPWNISIKIFGVPILRSILRSDLILVTDAILFDRNLFNPLFNYLSTMALVLPFARKKNIPVILYNVSLGPVSTRTGIYCLRKVLEASNEVIVRDTESLNILRKADIYYPNVKIGADCALNVAPPPAENIDTIMQKEGLMLDDKPIVTFNVNSYLDAFVRERSERINVNNFITIIASTVERIQSQLNVTVVFVVTQPMDLSITEKVISRIPNKDEIKLVTNLQYNYSELAGIFSRAEMHIGMRTHSLILASSVKTPVVGIIATPKNRGYMRSIKQDTCMVEFPDLTSERLWNTIQSTWEKRNTIRNEFTRIIKSEKEKARYSANLLSPYLNPKAVT